MSPRAKKTAVTILGAALGLYGICCGAARLLYPRVLFPAPQLDAIPSATAAAITKGGATRLTLTRERGAPTEALYYAPSTERGLVVVHFHGNGETMFDEIPTAEWLGTLGIGAMLVEYRGYGISRGPRPEEAGMYEDGEAALAYLEAHGVDRTRVALWGSSIGTGVAAELARRKRASRLVLVAPYTSVVDLGRRLLPWLPVSWLVTHRFDTLAKAREIDVPTLVIHGDADEIVPFEMGERVARAIRGASFVRVAGGHHNDLFAAELPGAGARAPSGEALLAIIASNLTQR